MISNKFNVERRKEQIRKDCRFFISEEALGACVYCPIDYYRVRTVRVGDIRRFFNGTILPLNKTEVYHFLSGGGTEEYQEYCEQYTRISEGHSTESYDSLISQLEKEEYDPMKGIILIDQNGIICDGFHRSCILLKKYGVQHKIKVLQIRKKRCGIRGRIKIMLVGGFFRYFRIFTI